MGALPAWSQRPCARWTPFIASLLVALVLPAGGATAKVSWSGPISLGLGPGLSGVYSLACPSPAQCTEVDAKGEAVTYDPASASGGRVLARRFVIEPDGGLGALACPATSQCTALDAAGAEITFDPRSGRVAAVGSVERNPPAPLSGAGTAAGAGMELSCPAVSQCTALDAVGREITFAPLHPHPVPPAAVAPGFGTLQCPSVAVCVVLGSGGQETTFDPAAGSPAPATVNLGLGGALSCPSASQCTAVGYIRSPTAGNAYRNVVAEATFDPAAPGTVAPVVVDQGSATLQAPGGLGGVLLACSSKVQCALIDTDQDARPLTGRRPAVPGLQFGLYREVTFDPTSGSASAPVAIAEFRAYPVPGFTALLCPAASRCVIGATGGVFRTLDPTTPAPGKEIPLPFDDGWPLAEITCPARSQCTALYTMIGRYFPPSGLSRFRTFDPLAPARPQRDLDVSALGAQQTGGYKLGGYTCASVRLCVAAVGYGIVSFHPATAHGAHVQPLTPARVTAVACPLATLCTAVGSRAAGRSRRVGIEVTFTPGARARARSRVVDGSPLTIVACRSAGLCTALDTRGRAVAFDPRGTHPPRVRRLGIGTLTALACPGTTRCAAVGASGQVAAFDPLASARVRRQHVVRGQPVTALACPTTTLCIALDRAGHAWEGNPFRRGRWTIRTVPLAGALRAVSCATDAECVAVDDLGHAFRVRVR